MRTHSEIIRDAGGWRVLREALKLPTSDYKPKFWYFRSSIPPEWWSAISELGWTTPSELAMAKHRQRYLKEKGQPEDPRPPAGPAKRGRPRKNDPE